MRAIALGCVLAGLALTGGCGPTGSGEKGAATASASADNQADQAAIEAVLAKIYGVIFDNEDAIVPEMSQSLAAAWTHCHDLQPKYEQATGESEGGYGKCLDDAGGFLPSTDVGLDGVKNRTTKVTILPPDAAVAEVTMRTSRNNAPGEPATVYLRMLRQSGQWKVDDLATDGHKDGTGYKAGLQSGIAQMEKRIGAH